MSIWPLCNSIGDFDIRTVMVRGSEQAVPPQAQPLEAVWLQLSPLIFPYLMGNLCSSSSALVIMSPILSCLAVGTEETSNHSSEDFLLSFSTCGSHGV